MQQMEITHQPTLLDGHSKVLQEFQDIHIPLCFQVLAPYYRLTPYGWNG